MRSTATKVPFGKEEAFTNPFPMKCFFSSYNSVPVGIVRWLMQEQQMVVQYPLNIAQCPATIAQEYSQG